MTEINLKTGDQRPPGNPGWLDLVNRSVSSLEFGEVHIIVHDSQVTQIERVEKVRLVKPRGGGGS